MRILILLLLPCFIFAQNYKPRAINVATGDTLWINSAQDSVFTKVSGNYVFAYKPKFKSLNNQFAGGTTGQYLKKNGNTEYDWGWSTVSASASFGALTGVYSDNSSLVSAFAGKQDAGSYSLTSHTHTGVYQPVLVNQTNIKSVNGNTLLGSGDLVVSGAGLGYTLSVQALTSSPTDAQTIYFGQLPKAPVTAAATSKIYIRKAGTIKMAQIYCYSGTAGTAEAWVINIRLNNTTDTQIASVSLGTNERIFTNSSLNISVVAGDYIEIKAVNPTWATNPLTCIFGGYIYIE